MRTELMRLLLTESAPSGVNRRLNALLFLTPLALVLVAAGCEPNRQRNYRPDTGPTRVGARILAGYEAEDREGPAAPGKPLCSLPVASPPVVSLPGAPDRPWAGPPRTLPIQKAPATEPAAPAPEPIIVRTSTAGRLVVGDAIDIQVDGHPEFSGRWTVKADGFLEIPDGGAFGPELLPGEEFSRSVGRIAALEPEEAGRGIGKALRPYLVKPPTIKVTPLARQGG